jgi:molybdate transport system regulatory protein
VLDQTDAMLLRYIEEERSLTKAAKDVGISYRNAWDRVKNMEKRLGSVIVETKVGGRTGGGARLTKEGARLVKEFRRTRKYLFNVLEEGESWEDVGYRFSARNRVPGKVVEVQKGTITSLVKMRVEAPVTLTSIITNEAAEDLALRQGDQVEAVVKSTDVLVAKRSPRPRMENAKE